MKVLLTTVLLIAITFHSVVLFAQDPSAISDMESTTQGILIPRMTEAQRDAIVSPAEGLLIYQLDGVPGFYFNIGSSLFPEWTHINKLQSVFQDSDADTRILLEKSGDDDIIRFEVDGEENFHMKKNQDGIARFELLNNGFNILIGPDAGDSLSSGQFNVVLGSDAMEKTKTASSNVAIGTLAMQDHKSGNFNVAIGNWVLQKGKTASGTVAIGKNAGRLDTNSFKNVLIGENTGSGSVLHAKSRNVMIGHEAGFSNQGSDNIFLGFNAGRNDISANHKLYIANTATSTPLIYGSFDGDSVVINGRLGINENYVFPPGNGDRGQSLIDDGMGNVNWSFIDSVPRLQDSDSGTKVAIYKNFAKNQINFELGNIEYFRMVQNSIGGVARLDIPNNQSNVLVGVNAGSDINGSGSSNVAIGTSTLKELTSGDNNIAIGNSAARKTQGSLNVAIGGSSLFNNKNGSRTVAIGSSSGELDTLSDDNVYIGFQAGQGDGTHSKNGNVMIGSRAGADCNGSDNVMIGSRAGMNESGSDKLYIDNSSAGSSTALIYGEFNSNTLRVNDMLGVGRTPATNHLEVEGTASKTDAGDWIANSDERLKKNIRQMNGQDMLQLLLHLRGVTFEWDDDKTGSKRPEGLKYGMIAQDIQKVFPTLVSEDAFGYLQTGYGTYDAMYVEIIRFLSEEIRTLQAENQNLKSSLQGMQSQVSENDNRLLLLEKLIQN